MLLTASSFPAKAMECCTLFQCCYFGNNTQISFHKKEAWQTVTSASFDLLPILYNLNNQEYIRIHIPTKNIQRARSSHRIFFEPIEEPDKLINENEKSLVCPNSPALSSTNMSSTDGMSMHQGFANPSGIPEELKPNTTYLIGVILEQNETSLNRYYVVISNNKKIEMVYLMSSRIIRVSQKCFGKQFIDEQFVTKQPNHPLLGKSVQLK